MQHHLSLLLAVVFTMTLAAAAQEPAAPPPAQGPSPAPAATEGLLLLRNGQVLQGVIRRVGEHYYLGLPDGEIRLRAADVELTCRDLEEGYRRKRELLQVENAAEHLQLGQWCQRHGLLAHAAAELAEARRLDPQHPMLPLAENRLQLALQPPPPPAVPPTPAERPVAFDELDRMVRQMPPGTVEVFTQSIQPLLTNNCMAAGCHGPQSETKYRLLRIPGSQPAGRRLTQRNLFETLKWIDQHQPEDSPLLKAATSPHGGKAAVFSEHHGGQYQKLADWVRGVGARPIAPVPATVALPTSPAKPAVSAAAAATATAPRPALNDGAVRPATHVEPEESTGLTPKDFAHPPAVPQMGSKVQRGAPGVPLLPADPLDPNSYYRRHFSKNEPTPAAPPPKPERQPPAGTAQ
jgi:hypothetical protein